MSRKLTRNAHGSGTIRQRKDGTWEARYTVGRDPGTGKQVQRSLYGKTQKEVRQRLQQISVDLENGAYTEPSKMKLGAWLDIWLKDFTGNVAEHTHVTYETQVRVHIKPFLGAIKLSDLKPHQIQGMYNSLARDAEKPLSPKTIKNINGVLHRALDQAVSLGYIKANPCHGIILPRGESPEMHPLTESEIVSFLEAIKGSPYQMILTIDLFTGLRQSEIMGLTWDRIDFKAGTILIDRQLLHEKKKGGIYKFGPPKNRRSRTLTPAKKVMELLQAQKKQQARDRLLVGSMWDDTFPGLVFTNQFGRNLSNTTLSHTVTRAGEKIGVPGLRFHDLRHTYAVAAIRAGDDIKSVQYNLGHATASFTLDKYAHYTSDMRRDSSARMDAFMASIGGL